MSQRLLLILRLVLGVALAGACGPAAASPMEGGLHWATENAGLGHERFALHDQLVSPAVHGHAAHFSWILDPSSPGSTTTTVTYFIDNHGGADALSTDQIARIRDAAGVWNSSGAAVQLVEVNSNLLADIHVHGDSTSACGSTVLGCSEETFFPTHNGTYPDGEPQHLLASQQVGGTEELTLLTRSDWYAGSDPTAIGGSQFDYMTAALHEFGHFLGLAHPDQAGGHTAAEIAASPMASTLSPGVTKRTLGSIDVEAVVFLYGAATPEPASMALFGVGIVTVVRVRRRRGRTLTPRRSTRGRSGAGR